MAVGVMLSSETCPSLPAESEAGSKPLKQVVLPSSLSSSDDQLQGLDDQGLQRSLVPPPPSLPLPKEAAAGHAEAGEPPEATAAPAAEKAQDECATADSQENDRTIAADESPRPPFRRLSYEELLQQRVPAGTPRPPSLPGGWEAVWESTSRRYYYRDPTYSFYLESPPLVVDGDFGAASDACVIVVDDSTTSAAGGSGTTAATVNSVTLHAGNLELADDGVFDPLQPEFSEKLFQMLGVGDGATAEKLPGFQGGLNEGVWALREAPGVDGHSQEWIMKLVRGKRLVPALPTEAENLDRLVSEHPGIVADALLAFPIRTVGCLGTSGKAYDLIVMRRAPGERLAEVICHMWYAGRHEDLWVVIQRVGAAVAEFHARYLNSQHGDMQPSNIFWDESSQQVTFIDVGGMGVPVERGDVDHFAHAVQLLATAYGNDFEADCLHAFQSGYSPNDKPVEEPFKKPVQEPLQEPVKEPIDESVDEPVDKPVGGIEE